MSARVLVFRPPAVRKKLRVVPAEQIEAASAPSLPMRPAPFSVHVMPTLTFCETCELVAHDRNGDPVIKVQVRYTDQTVSEGRRWIEILERYVHEHDERTHGSAT